MCGTRSSNICQLLSVAMNGSSVVGHLHPKLAPVTPMPLPPESTGSALVLRTLRYPPATDLVCVASLNISLTLTRTLIGSVPVAPVTLSFMLKPVRFLDERFTYWPASTLGEVALVL